MLKYIVYSVMLMMSVESWVVIQSLLFMMSVLFSLDYVSSFSMSKLSLSFGVDSISWSLILLSIWITALVIMGSQKILISNNYPMLFLVMNILLLVSLILTFSCLNYLMFYMCFECSLIPTLILILGWGYQPERLQAGVYMLFYTLFASLPLLVSLISLYSIKGSLMIGLISVESDMNKIMYFWYMCTVVAFIVKLPMFMVHLWLPKAHVEAPVAGSMILAGVLLKLGGYGLLRVLPMFPQVGKSMSWVWVSFGMLGGCLISLMCLHQVDVKSIIAYSSVAHMGVVLSGLMVFNMWGWSGAMEVMIGHGLCSSGMFCLANMMYERMGSRSLLISKGVMNFMPSMAMWWFLLSVGNMAAPITLNLLGEASLIMSLNSWSKVLGFSIGGLCFLSAAYTLYLYSLSQHGKHFSMLFSCCSGKVREYLSLMLHWLPLNGLIMKSSSLLFF